MELQPRTGLVRPTLKISVLLINRPLDPRSPSPSDGQGRHLRGLVILRGIRYTVAVIRTIPTTMTAHSPAAGRPGPRGCEQAIATESHGDLSQWIPADTTAASCETPTGEFTDCHTGWRVCSFEVPS
jgi:hypothetical protein